MVSMLRAQLSLLTPSVRTGITPQSTVINGAERVWTTANFVNVYVLYVLVTKSEIAVEA
jgi:hypothetical protein